MTGRDCEKALWCRDEHCPEKDRLVEHAAALITQRQLKTDTVEVQEVNVSCTGTNEVPVYVVPPGTGNTEKKDKRNSGVRIHTCGLSIVYIKGIDSEGVRQDWSQPIN